MLLALDEEGQMDVLSDVLRAVRLTGAIFFDVEARTPWVAQTPAAEKFAGAVMPGSEHVIGFHVLTQGSCWAEAVDGSVQPVRLHTGDLIVLPGGDEHVLCSVPGMRAIPDLSRYRRPVNGRLPLPVWLNEGGGPETCHFVCGYFGCDARPFNPVLEGLPRMVHSHISVETRSWLSNLIRVAVQETEHGSAGGETMLAKLAELMFVEVIRKYIDALPSESRSWFSGLRDRHVGAALRLIHARPSEPLTLESLARDVGLSRSVFAERFAHFVGVPPMHYLARWRLQLATQLLEGRGTSIAAAAAAVGYESEAAFNRAFKKFVGVPPGAWRRSHDARPVEPRPARDPAVITRGTREEQGRVNPQEFPLHDTSIRLPSHEQTK
jgi:AraC-like DNA-binding protein